MFGYCSHFMGYREHHRSVQFFLAGLRFIPTALLVDFILGHDDFCPDISLRQSVYRAIVREVEAVLASASEIRPGLIPLGDLHFNRAGLAAGLAWLRERIILSDGDAK